MWHSIANHDKRVLWVCAHLILLCCVWQVDKTLVWLVPWGVYVKGMTFSRPGLNVKTPSFYVDETITVILEEVLSMPKLHT